MNEENTTIMPPEKQIVQDDRDARAEELESAFSYDGYQVVRKELFAHLRDPAIVIRKDSIGSHDLRGFWVGQENVLSADRKSFSTAATCFV